ncbi:MAG: Heavy metal efflux outer membrane protein CzcC family [Labilithrix sp.]|nr:Heavy metal efflux outer membrane protein CzcC family [Labilithrix sp.]
MARTWAYGPVAGIALAIASRAHAQQVKPLDPNAPTPTTPVPVGAAGALPPAPPPPPVDDPMLTPPPAAGRELMSWSDAVTLSRARSTDIGTALAEVRRAEAQTRTALAAVLPTINGTVSYPHQFLTKETSVLGNPGDPPRSITTPQSDYFNGNVTLSQSIVNVQAWHSIKTGKENEKSARLSAEDTQRTITLGVATAVVGVVAAERVAELNRIGLRTALERRELATRKRALGVGTGLDVVRADQDVSTARASVVSGDEALRRSREALGLAVGVPEQVGVARSIQIDAVAAEAERTCPRIKDIGERTDVAATRQRVVVAERNVGNVERSFLPTLNAQSTLASTTADLGGNQPRTTWNVTAVLSIPIWDGGARYGALGNARALRDEATFQLEAQRRTVTVEVAQAQRGITVAEAALDVARQAEKQAAEVDRLTQTAYRAGQGTSLELVIAAAALRQADVELALREFELVRARLEALFALARCPGTT